MQAPSLSDILDAAVRIGPILFPTPLLPSRSIQETPFYLKPENLQRTGSFKIRGAYLKLSLCDPRLRSRGVVTYSSGNHGQAVACAAALLGCKSTVVMSEGAVAEKRDAAAAYGAEIVSVPGGSDERRRVGEERARQGGLALVPPYDDPQIIAGQGSVGLEIAQALPDVEQVLVPVGGGGLLSGIALALRELAPNAQVIGVEPEGADDLFQSLATGRLVSLSATESAADGLRTQSVGSLNFRIIEQSVAQVVRVSEEQIRFAVRELLLREKLLVEPSGAVAYAAFCAGAVPQDRKTVAILSGGNISSGYLRAVVGEG